MLHVSRNIEKIEIRCRTKTQNFVISEHLPPWKLSQNVRLLVKVIVLDVSGMYIWHPYWLSAQSQTVGNSIFSEWVTAREQKKMIQKTEISIKIQLIL